MAKKKTGELIKEARTGKGLTQEQLAKKVKGLTAADISKAERNEIQLSQAQLKEIAKATGVTQKSLLDSVSSAKSSSKTGSSAKKPAASGKTGAGSGMKLTETEQKLVKLYRAADVKTRKAAMEMLEEKKSDLGDMVSSLLNNKAVKDAVSQILKK